MKTIRKPLTDIYGRDFMTGEVVSDIDSIDVIKVGTKKAKKRLDAKRKEAVNGSVYVDGLGYVAL